MYLGSLGLYIMSNEELEWYLLTYIHTFLHTSLYISLHTAHAPRSMIDIVVV